MATAQTTVTVKQVEKIGFFHAFFTQSDFTNRVCRETWYGHHAPWRRIMFWVLLSCLIETFITLPLLEVSEIPILQHKTNKEIQEMRDLHYECAKSICDVAKEIPLDCIIHSDGESAHVDFDTYNGPDYVPFPHVCFVAFEKTFGKHGRQKEEESDYLFHIRWHDEVSANRLAIFKLHPDCLLQIFQSFNDTKNDEADMIVGFPLVNFTNVQPGERRTFVLKAFVCPEEMSPVMRENALPAMQSAHEWFLTHHYLVYGVGTFLIAFAIFMAGLCFLMVRLLAPTLLVRWVLPWPRDFVGFRQIGFWSTWSTLVLICTITGEKSFVVGTALLVLLAAAALYYGDKKAAIEWAFIGALWRYAHDMYPVLDYTRSQISLFDYFNLIGIAGSLIAFFIPGTGWWKLVTLYAFCRSYSSLKEGMIKDQNVGGAQLSNEGSVGAQDNHVKRD